ncbi:cell division protein [Corynebacterium sp. 13CS0277]|uniref:ParB/RepB/Spo0J family partition protein n=1 Tax=Corynebacterium sp. 13CS0277 TaxID=2071994 RepID=UPI000D038E73|nr:ParB/RepB/Spo0J family partition protein [Corynebacterium sp. 13CS0277]PRQ11094.1 cell division protein [Corynebacterium sp. 13CS0277]
MAKESNKGGLGRGLGALIGANTTSPKLGQSAADIVLSNTASPATVAAKRAGNTTPAKPGAQRRSTPQGGAQRPSNAVDVDEFGATYQELPIGTIVPNAKQPRQVFDEEQLNELIHSITEFGVMQPIVVRPNSTKDGYEIIMGERRWRAASKAGLKRIPAIIRHTADGDMLRDALLENIHRAQLNPLEEAAAYQQLLEEFGVTQAELADKIGRSRPVITNMIRLLQLPVPVQRKVAAGVLSAGHARALLGLHAGAAAQEALAERVIREGMSVRATEEAVVLANRGDAPAAKREKAPTPEFFVTAAERLADGLDTKVTVSAGKKKGKIVVEFAGKDDFERIMAILEGK